MSINPLYPPPALAGDSTALAGNAALDEAAQQRAVQRKKDLMQLESDKRSALLDRRARSVNLRKRPISGRRELNNIADEKDTLALKTQEELLAVPAPPGKPPTPILAPGAGTTTLRQMGFREAADTLDRKQLREVGL